MENNVRRVFPPTQAQRQRLCNLPVPAQKEREIERETTSLIDESSQPTPLPNPIANAASISLALGNMVNSSVFSSKTGGHSQLRLKPSGTTVSTARLKPLPTRPVTLPKQPQDVVPSQLSSDIPLLTPTVPPPKRSAKSGTSSFPDYLRLRQNSPGPNDPSNGAAVRKAVVVWFRNDLRLHDNETLNAANNESSSVLPVYCFDPRDYGKSSSGFDKTGPYRATFLLECVANLRANLRERGSDLVVRVGKPEEVLVELAKNVGADALYAHQEVSHDEIKAENKITAALKEEGVEAKFFWGSTLYHLEDLPFKLDDMPSNYGTFRDKVQSLSVRQILEPPKRLKGLPVRGSVEPGEIPTLLDLGLSPQNAKSQSGKSTANASLVGGETEAFQRLKMFATEYRGQPQKVAKDGSGDSLYGANFSCKISPWLAMGCLSPRYMFEELKKNKNSSISSSLGKASGSDGGLNWLTFELLWRDFFRFITKKYSSAKKSQTASPAIACAGPVPA